MIAIDALDIARARERIAPFLAPTPCPRCVWLDKHTGGAVYLKLENLHPSGSFKERGARNKLMALTDDERKRGIIAASAGNHAQAVALHAQKLGIKAAIVMPIASPWIKIENTRSYGAEVILAGGNYDEAYQEARRIAADRGAVYVHAFDDPAIIAGQGTMGLEILEQLPAIDVVVIPVGGGGLIAGTALAIKAARPHVRVIGVEAAQVPSMRDALQAGHPVDVKGGPTIADGIAVRRVSQSTLSLVREYVGQIVLVTEEEIASAILFLLEREKTVAEGAGAVAVAALLAGKIPGLEGKTVCAVVGGGNIDVSMLGNIIDRGLVKEGRLVRLRLKVSDRPGGLAEVVDLFAARKANIVDIRHERAFSHSFLGDVDIEVTLETRGRDHVVEIREALAGIAKEVVEL